MTKIILSILALLMPFLGYSATEADNLLDNMVEWTSARKTVEVDYTIQSGDASAKGTIVIDGKRFRVRSEILDAWYDGTNQWSYSPQTKEVSITTPSEEELQQINPFSIIAAFRRNYNASYKQTDANTKHRVVELTPKDKGSDITKVEISVPVGYLYPARIVVRISSGETLVINTSRIIRGKKFSDNDFVYDRGIYPDAEIIDLR